MSKLLNCAKSYCFSKQLVDAEDDALSIGWSKHTCLSCGDVKFICGEHEDE